MITTYTTLALIYFLSMLRSSNLVPVSRHKLDLRRLLTWGDIHTTEFGIVITIHVSKTIQHGQRKQTIPLAASPDPRYCPVTALRRLVSLQGIRNCKADAPVFRFPSADGGLTPVQKSDFEGWFKIRLRQMGHDPTQFTLHSYRHGGIHQCLLTEGNLALCKVTSDHSSDTILSYASVPAERHMGISTRIIHSLANSVD